VEGECPDLRSDHVAGGTLKGNEGGDMSKEKRVQEIVQLKNKLRVLEAGQLSALCSAYKNVDRCGQDRFMASAVTITIRSINVSNNTIVEEVAISDGLSVETITAIKADIKRSLDLLMSYPHNKI
jgi:hypothetical protein